MYTIKSLCEWMETVLKIKTWITTEDGQPVITKRNGLVIYCKLINNIKIHFILFIKVTKILIIIMYKKKTDQLFILNYFSRSTVYVNMQEPKR